MNQNQDMEAFAPNIWIIDGPPVRDFGILFTTRMTVVKLADGLVWIESPIAVPFETLQRITVWGPVRYLVTTTPRHVWRLAAWHTLFPDAQLWAPRPTLLMRTYGHLPLTGTLTDTPPRDWSGDFDQLAFQGNPLGEEVLFFHQASRTVILGDLIQMHPSVKGKPLRNAFFQLEGVAGPMGGVGLDIRLSFTNRTLARRSLDKLLSWDARQTDQRSWSLHREGCQAIRGASVPMAQTFVLWGMLSHMQSPRCSLGGTSRSHAKEDDLWRLLIAARMASIAGWPICLAGSTDWVLDGFWDTVWYRLPIEAARADTSAERSWKCCTMTGRPMRSWSCPDGRGKRIGIATCNTSQHAKDTLGGCVTSQFRKCSHQKRLPV